MKRNKKDSKTTEGDLTRVKRIYKSIYHEPASSNKRRHIAILQSTGERKKQRNTRRCERERERGEVPIGRTKRTTRRNTKKRTKKKHQ